MRPSVLKRIVYRRARRAGRPRNPTLSLAVAREARRLTGSGRAVERQLCERFRLSRNAIRNHLARARAMEAEAARARSTIAAAVQRMEAEAEAARASFRRIFLVQQEREKSDK